jgi:hypothetical protein
MAASVFSGNSFETDALILYCGFNPVNLFCHWDCSKTSPRWEPLHVFPNGEPPVRRQRFIPTLIPF